ncbi:hypothetical protein SAMN03159496_05196 [Rhizobium sp. NFR07]|nr:hypothetical protein SAMN03159496_05196 [Rhizobium sp. NFR07]
MIDIRAPKQRAKTIRAPRETQRHLECLTRQIMARAGRQATTVNVQSRTSRRSGTRTYYRELIDRLTFERWVELDMIACRLAVQEQIIGALQRRDDVPVHRRAT